MGIKTLLNFISKPESNGDWNAVWGGIKKADRPKVPLTTMTVREILAWQDSIDPYYRSEAAGRYQFMEDTLRSIYTKAGVLLSDKFNEATQDKLATYLLRVRGLDEYLEGKISAETFANNLAKEWASLPVVTGSKKGRSYYAGDGLNKSHVSVEDFLAAVRSVKAVDDPVVTPPVVRPAQPVGWLAALLQALSRLFKGGR